MSKEEDRTALAARQQQYFETLGDGPPGYQQWVQALPQKLQQRVRAHVNRMKHGLFAVAPLLCFGEDGCPFLDHCPLKGTGQYPEGLQCVLEAEYVAQKVSDYMQHLQVDPSNPVETSLVNELALIDLLKNRAAMVLSGGDRDDQGRDLMRIETTWDQNGNESTSAQLHPALDYMDRLERRRQGWLDRLQETRKAKSDLALKLGTNQEQNATLEKLKVVQAMIEDMRANPVALIEGDEGLSLEEDDE